MQRAKVFIYVCAGLFLLALSTTADPADARQVITARLLPSVPTVRQGDTLRFELTFTNVGTAPVRLWTPLQWGSGNEPPVTLRIRSTNGVEMALEPAPAVQGLYVGVENYVVLAPADSVSIRLESTRRDA